MGSSRWSDTAGDGLARVAAAPSRQWRPITPAPRGTRHICRARLKAERGYEKAFLRPSTNLVLSSHQLPLPAPQEYVRGNRFVQSASPGREAGGPCRRVRSRALPPTASAFAIRRSFGAPRLPSSASGFACGSARQGRSPQSSRRGANATSRKRSPPSSRWGALSEVRKRPLLHSRMIRPAGRGRNLLVLARR